MNDTWRIDFGFMVVTVCIMWVYMGLGTNAVREYIGGRVECVICYCPGCWNECVLREWLWG